MRTACLVSMLILVVTLGCGGQAPNSKTAGFEVGKPEARVLQDGAKAAPAAAVKGEDAAPIERKIVHTATLELVVKNIDTLRPNVEKLVEETKGYVAKSDLFGEAGRNRKASWTLKIPVADYRKALEALLALGQPIRNVSDSQDVTEEFVDLSARVRNFKAEETTLNKMLTEQAVKMDDMLKIREQIRIVRGEIERAEGRMNFLSKTAAMATIQLTAREEQTYVPEKPEAAPTFSERVSGRFSDSLQSVLDFCKAVVVIFVGAAPWLVLLTPPLLLIAWVTRRMNRKLAASVPAKPMNRDPKPRRAAPTVSEPPSAPPASSPEAP